MFIQLANTWLTNPNDGTSQRLVTSSRDLVIDGETVVQEADIPRAVSKLIIDRGNLAHTITFRVTRQFTTIAEAFGFAASYRSTLPTSGALVMVAGWSGEVQRTLTAPLAVLKDCKWDTSDSPGVSVTHAFTLRCGAITLQPLPLLGTESGGAIGTESGGTIGTESIL